MGAGGSLLFRVAGLKRRAESITDSQGRTMIYDELSDRQKSDVAALAVLTNMDHAEEIIDVPGVTIADLIIMSKNWVWRRGGCEEVKLIEMALEEYIDRNRDQPGLE